MNVSTQRDALCFKQRSEVDMRFADISHEEES
jgi:hypothetical protein